MHALNVSLISVSKPYQLYAKMIGDCGNLGVEPSQTCPLAGGLFLDSAEIVETAYVPLSRGDGYRLCDKACPLHYD